MVLFCPTCANILLIENGAESYRFFCKTCPYIYNVKEKLTSRMDMDKKKLEDLSALKKDDNDVV